LWSASGLSERFPRAAELWRQRRACAHARAQSVDWSGGCWLWLEGITSSETSQELDRSRA
jgi:hypothetical protein